MWTILENLFDNADKAGAVGFKWGCSKRDPGFTSDVRIMDMGLGAKGKSDCSSRSTRFSRPDTNTNMERAWAYIFLADWPGDGWELTGQSEEPVGSDLLIGASSGDVIRTGGKAMVDQKNNLGRCWWWKMTS